MNGGSDSELWVFIFPMKWGAIWSYQEFPNHILVIHVIVFFVGNPVLIPQDHDELVVREPPYCRHRMPIWWLISPYIPLYPWWVNRNVCCKHAMKCIELPSSGLRYRTGKRRILSCLRCTHPSESKHGKWIFFIQYIYICINVCIYI